MHDATTNERLYCLDISSFQAANSFLWTVRPIAPEMIFQLSAIKVACTDKMTKQFRPPYPGQEADNAVYQLYLRRHRQEEDLSLLQWLRNHTTSNNNAKALNGDKYLVAVKYISVFNPVFFHQHLLVNHTHRESNCLRHPEEASMPVTIRHFAQAVLLRPEQWTGACKGHFVIIT